MTSLNPEEQKLLNSVENEEWKSIDNVSEEIKRYQTYAASQLSQNEIKVTLSDEDIAKIQALANQLGQSISDLTKEINL